MSKYLIFKSKGETLAIDIDSIERILEYSEPNRVPGCPAYVLGVIQYAGKVLSLVDLTRKLYGADFNKSRESKIIISYLDGGYIGLVVDKIIDIKSFDEEKYEENINYRDLDKEYIKGFIKLGDSRKDIVLIVDIDKLFTKEELKYLEVGSSEELE